MNEQLKQKLKEIPEAPGIYQMLDKNGTVIYIGKSKCLKKRVHSYFVPSPVWEKARQMSHFIVDLRYVVTDTHLEAMLLECELIKKMKPYFNSMMKNDQRYMFLTLEENYRRNPLKITSTREELSFGPFRSRGMLQDSIEMMRNLYPLTKEKTKYLCEYHIFPCEMDKEAFAKNRKMLEKLFSGKTEMERFRRALSREMKAAAQRQSFERAAQYRNLMENLEYLGRSLSRFEEWHKKDVIYEVALEEGCKLFYISDGQIVLCEKAAENTEAVRQGLIRRAKLAQEDFLREKALRNEKELLDYRDIVYAELAGNQEKVYEGECENETGYDK